MSERCQQLFLNSQRIQHNGICCSEVSQGTYHHLELNSSKLIASWFAPHAVPSSFSLFSFCQQQLAQWQPYIVKACSFCTSSMNSQLEMGMSSDGDHPVMPTLKVVVRVWSMKCIVASSMSGVESFHPARWTQNSWCSDRSPAVE